MQPSSLPVDRRARRAKTDIINVEMLLRTLMAWLRGEPRVCSMVPIPSEDDEEARRASGTGGFDRGTAIDRQQDRRHFGDAGRKGIQGFAARSARAIELRASADGDPIPPKAKARIERLLIDSISS
jgi:transposase